MCVRGIYPTHPYTKRASRNPSAVATISTLWSSGGAAVGHWVQLNPMIFLIIALQVLFITLMTPLIQSADPIDFDGQLGHCFGVVVLFHSLVVIVKKQRFYSHLHIQ
jgi:hypothetical protein